MTYKDTLDFLYSQVPAYHKQGKSAYKPNLDNSKSLDVYFSHPHKSYKCIHIAGTNGKGSTSHILAAALQEMGYKVGLFTSPHLIDFRERIKVDGKEIPEEEVISFTKDHWHFIKDIEPSFFELTTAMAFLHFKNEKVDVAIIEVGLGGRLDSTNIITPILSIITNIGKDHTEFLGDTLPEIAGEKAGIIKNSIPVVIGETDIETEPVFIKKAKENNSEIVFADKNLILENNELKEGLQYFNIETISDEFFKGTNLNTIALDLLGSYQKKNLSTAIVALQLLKNKNLLEIDFCKAIESFTKVKSAVDFNGRWQILSNNPLTICDTGHNAHGIKYIVEQLSKLEYNKLYFVIGVVNDKDLSSILPLLPRDAYYIFTQANIERALNSYTLYEECTKAGLNGEIQKSVALAKQRVQQLAKNNDIIFIGGSTFIVAEAI